MTTPLPLQITGSPISTDPNPNNTPPTRIWLTPAHQQSSDDASGLVLELKDGTSVTGQVWVLLDTGVWGTDGPAVTILAGAISSPVPVVGGGASVFFQVTVVVGSPTKLYAGFSDIGGGALGVSGVVTSLAGIPDVIALGRFNATPPTLADGNGVAIQLDANGNLKVAEQFGPGYEDNSLGVAKTVIPPLASAVYAPNVAVNLATLTTANLKPSQGNIFAVVATNANAAIRYFQIHNKASAPATSDVPAVSFLMPAGTATVPFVLKVGTETFTENGINLALGVSYAISTAVGTYQAATAADHTSTVVWK